VNRSLPTRILREHPDIDQLRRQAKEMLDAYRAGDRDAATEVNSHYRDANPATFALHDVQLVVARAYGYDSWPKLKAFVDGVNVAALAEAVKSNDLEKVRDILKIRPELVNMETEHNEQRPIHYAVYNRSSEMVRLLMQLGADAHEGIWPNRDATGAFTIAFERGYGEIVAIILEEEQGRPPRPGRTASFRDSAFPADVTAAARCNDEDAFIAALDANPSAIHTFFYLTSPLHIAARKAWERAAVWLVAHGADVNGRDEGRGPSPLELAAVPWPRNGPARNPDSRIVRLLRDAGAELTPRAAIGLGDAAAVRRFHAEGKLAQPLPKEQGARGIVETAVFYNRPEMVSLLLDLGYDPDDRSPEGENQGRIPGGPLHAALEQGSTAMAEILLSRGATLTPRAAVALGRCDWLREQQEAGALENPIGPEGGLVSAAVRCNRADILSLLLDLGLDPNERVRVEGLEEIVYSAGAPLRECANRGKLELAKILLEHGADPNTSVYAASSALGNAYGAKNQEMIRLLESYGARLSAAETGYVRQTEVARKMLAGELDPRLEVGTGSDTTTAAEILLWSGASGGDPEIVRMSLEKVDWPRDDQRWFWILWRPTPGHEAWKEEDRERFIECFGLILARSNPNLRAGYGQSMLHEVISRDHEDRAALAQMLLDAGARTDFRDDLLKSTPLGWACRWGRMASVKLLLERGADPIEPDAEPWATPHAWAEKTGHKPIIAVLQEYAPRK
jgi:ankyrin repeat protein